MVALGMFLETLEVLEVEWFVEGINGIFNSLKSALMAPKGRSGFFDFHSKFPKISLALIDVTG